MNTQNHLVFQKENEGRLDLYTLASGIRISFNEIYTSSWEKGDSSIFGERMLILNFCVHGRCNASLAQNQYAIVKENQVCVSTVLPTNPEGCTRAFSSIWILTFCVKRRGGTFSRKWASRQNKL